MQIIWYKKAQEDLNDNVSYIAKRSKQNALLVLDGIISLCDSLASFPFKFPKEPIYNQENIRFVTKWSFKIIYRVDKDCIYILRIFNTNQSPEKILDTDL